MFLSNDNSIRFAKTEEGVDVVINGTKMIVIPQSDFNEVLNGLFKLIKPNVMSIHLKCTEKYFNQYKCAIYIDDIQICKYTHCPVSEYVYALKEIAERIGCKSPISPYGYNWGNASSYEELADVFNEYLVDACNAEGVPVPVLEWEFVR